MEGSSSRNLGASAAEDLDSTVLRHQVERYLNELQEEADTPLQMNFLGMKTRRPLSTSRSHVQLRTPGAADSFLPKKFRFDTTATADSSLTDFGSTFASARRPAQASVHENERQLSAKEAEIVKLQQKVVETEMRLSEALTEKSRMEAEVQNTRDVSRTQIRLCENKIEDLQLQLDRLKASNEALARESQTKKELAERWKLAVAEEKLKSSRELTKADQLLSDSRSDHETELARLKRDLESAQRESQKIELELEENKAELERLRLVSASTPSEPSCDHQSVIDQQRQVILAMENALFAQRTAASQSQEAKLARIPQMEKELAQLQETNKILRETAANEMLLKEQISSLQASIQRYKDQCQLIPSLQSDLKQMADRLGDWKSLARSLFQTDSLPAVKLLVEELCQKKLALMEEAGSLRVELNSTNRQIAELLEQVATLKEVKKGRAELEDRVRRLERKLIVVQKDRDHYRAVNEMYEVEMTRVGAPASASKESVQIRELEKLLEEYRALMGDSNEVSAKNQQIALLNQTIDSLQKELALATSKIQQEGDTRVLHFTSNPLDNARARTLEQLRQLEKENESLRERVRLMEAGQTQNLTLLVGEHFEQGCTPERLKELEEKLKSCELKNQRVEEVFRKYCSDFRRGIFELFGYQVDNDECGNFKLTSVFSESSQDYLAFKYVGDGLMVMDTPYVHTIDDLVQTHITNQKSIPIFLASHQIDLFSRQQSMINSSTSMMLSTPG